MGAQRRIRRRKNRQSLNGDNRRVAFAPWTWTSIRPKQNGYDAKYRLTNGNFSAPASVNYTYTYDDVNNRTFSGEPAAATFTYNAFGQITTSISAGVVSTYTYDVNGNLTNVNAGGTFTTMSYDKENRMTVSQTNAARTTYTYDGDGLKRSENSGSGVTTIVWDGSDYVGEITSGSFSKRIQTIDSMILALETGGTRKDLVSDMLGSILAEIDQSQTASATNRWAPYGNTISTIGTSDKWGWIGSWGYRETSLTFTDLYIRARHYGKVAGVWTALDPLWPLQNAYVYSGNRPTVLTDPSGLFFPIVIGGVMIFTAAETLLIGVIGGGAVSISICQRHPELCQAPKIDWPTFPPGGGTTTFPATPCGPTVMPRIREWPWEIPKPIPWSRGRGRGRPRRRRGPECTEWLTSICQQACEVAWQEGKDFIEGGFVGPPTWGTRGDQQGFRNCCHQFCNMMAAHCINPLNPKPKWRCDGPVPPGYQLPPF